jgi:hypothetical protein
MLASSYDHPTAELSEEKLEEFKTEIAEWQGLTRLFEGLRFVKTMVSEASVGISEKDPNRVLEVQGTVHTRFPCPGDSSYVTTDSDINGTVDATFGIKHSRLNRGWSGWFKLCRFRFVDDEGLPRVVTLDGDIIGDIGADSMIGEPLAKPLLLKLMGFTGTMTSPLYGKELALTKGDYNLRLTVDDAVETLVDLSALEVGDAGTLVVGLTANRTFYIRDKLYVWSCAGEGNSCASVE